MSSLCLNQSTLPTMSLLNYFSKKSSLLPNPNGALSQRMPAANKEVKCLVDVKEEESRSKRGQYRKYSDEERAKVAKCASEMGVTNSMRFFKKEFHDRPLKFKRKRCAYLEEQIRTRTETQTQVWEINQDRKAGVCQKRSSSTVKFQNGR